MTGGGVRWCQGVSANLLLLLGGCCSQDGENAQLVVKHPDGDAGQVTRITATPQDGD